MLGISPFANKEIAINMNAIPMVLSVILKLGVGIFIDQ
jgi:hypothetical protein